MGHAVLEPCRFNPGLGPCELRINFCCKKKQVKMQIKTTMRYHFTLARLVLIRKKKQTHKMSINKDMERLKHVCIGVGDVKW